MNTEPIDRSTRKHPFGISVIIFMMILYSLLLALIFVASRGVNYGDDAIQLLDMKGAPIGILLLQYSFFPIFIIFELSYYFWTVAFRALGLVAIDDPSWLKHPGRYLGIPPRSTHLSHYASQCYNCVLSQSEGCPARICKQG